MFLTGAACAAPCAPAPAAHCVSLLPVLLHFSLPLLLPGVLPCTLLTAASCTLLTAALLTGAACGAAS